MQINVRIKCFRIKYLRVLSAFTEAALILKLLALHLAVKLDGSTTLLLAHQSFHIKDKEPFLSLSMATKVLTKAK